MSLPVFHSVGVPLLAADSARGNEVAGGRLLVIGVHVSLPVFLFFECPQQREGEEGGRGTCLDSYESGLAAADGAVAVVSAVAAEHSSSISSSSSSSTSIAALR